jgi:hypothetical protein
MKKKTPKDMASKGKKMLYPESSKIISPLWSVPTILFATIFVETAIDKMKKNM